jgi:hypothetical protein
MQQPKIDYYWIKQFSAESAIDPTNEHAWVVIRTLDNEDRAGEINFFMDPKCPQKQLLASLIAQAINKAQADFDLIIKGVES